MIAEGWKQGIKTAAISVVRHPGTVRNSFLRAGAARGRRLVLNYHGVAPRCGRIEVVAPILPEVFAEQMRALKTVGDIVPLARLLSWSGPSIRPAFAVTFDDDDPRYVRHLLPILCELGICATFFLSGRSLHGLGAYWWTLVDQSIEEVGLEATARMLGHSARTVEELATLCTRAAMVKELSPRVTPPAMQPDDIRTLARAGMTIGFHTLRHPVLPLLNDTELDRAITEGRDALSSAAGAPVEFLAYPYGSADARVARAAECAGYTAAFTAEWRAVSPRSHPFLMSRWQPGTVNARDLLGEAALRLNLHSAYTSGRA